jgi:hypothetical protein
MPAVHLTLDVRPLLVTPDGTARVLTRALFTDARGRPTTPLAGGNVDFFASRGDVQWQTRLRFNAPAAVISVTDEGALTINVRTDAQLGSLSGSATVAVAAPDLSTSPRVRHRRRVSVLGVGGGFSVSAIALGAHLVEIGWFPRQLRGTMIVRRTGPDGTKTIGVLGSPSSFYRDVTPMPGVRYRYTVMRKGYVPQNVDVELFTELPSASVTAVAGKGMWLTFSPDPRDDDGYTKIDPQAIVDRAVRAGLHFIELRTAYGPYWELTPPVQPVINALIDRAAKQGIRIVGWTVPRSAGFDDLAASVATAAYTTPRGNHFAGLVVDLERGAAFMGEGPRGYAAIIDYTHILRAALGSRYPLIVTIEDPFIEHLTNKEYPYAAIAANADVLQPMVYWSVLSDQPLTTLAVEAAVARSYAMTLRAAHRRIRINVGGQTAPLDARGAPTPEEITASLKAARALGALGETFFSWGGTNDAQWDALADYHWPVRRGDALPSGQHPAP